jgi:DNA-binding MarR family transcriptional regulator
VIHYWQNHGPCSLRQVMRGTGVERSRLKRIIRELEKIGALNNSPLHTAQDL